MQGYMHGGMPLPPARGIAGDYGAEPRCGRTARHVQPDDPRDERSRRTRGPRPKPRRWQDWNRELVSGCFAPQTDAAAARQSVNTQASLWIVPWRHKEFRF